MLSPTCYSLLDGFVVAGGRELGKQVVRYSTGGLPLDGATESLSLGAMCARRFVGFALEEIGFGVESRYDLKREVAFPLAAAYVRGLGTGEIARNTRLMPQGSLASRRSRRVVGIGSSSHPLAAPPYKMN